MNSSAIDHAVKGGNLHNDPRAPNDISFGANDSPGVDEVRLASISESDEGAAQLNRVPESHGDMWPANSELSLASTDGEADAVNALEVTSPDAVDVEENQPVSGNSHESGAATEEKKSGKIFGEKFKKLFRKKSSENRANTPTSDMRDRFRESMSDAGSKLKSICEATGQYGKNYAKHVAKGCEWTLEAAMLTSKVLEVPIQLVYRTAEVALAAGLVAVGAAVSATTGVITLLSFGNVDIFTLDPFEMSCEMAGGLVKDAVSIDDSIAGRAANKTAALVGLPATAVVGGSITLVAALGTAAFAKAN